LCFIVFSYLLIERCNT